MKTDPILALANIKNPCVDSILIALNGGKRQSMFLKKPKTYDSGSKEYLTKVGIKNYKRLVSILFAVGRLTDTNMEDIVTTIDSIIDENDQYSK